MIKSMYTLSLLVLSFCVLSSFFKVQAMRSSSKPIHGQMLYFKSVLCYLIPPKELDMGMQK